MLFDLCGLCKGFSLELQTRSYLNTRVNNFRFIYGLALSQVKICRPPPLFRSGHLDRKDALCAETKDALKKIISHHIVFLSYGRPIENQGLIEVHTQ